MTGRPILFSTPMVHALLDGRKTQTRRLAWRETKWRTFVKMIMSRRMVPTIWQSVKPGDRLWVRETWRHTAEGVWTVASARNAHGGKVEYKADHENDWHGGFPSIHMPREFSRITLIVTATKTERVKEITPGDAELEGAFASSRIGDGPCHATWSMTGEGWRSHVPDAAFATYWQSLHTKPGARWEDNPEVVALTFEVHKANIDAMKAAA